MPSFFFVLSFVAALGMPIPCQETTGSSEADVSGKELAKRLLMDLEETLARTDSAHVTVKRVQEIIKSVEELSKSGEAEDQLAVPATAELVGLLRTSLENLNRDAVTVRDRVRNEVLPEYNAVAAKMKARLAAVHESDVDKKKQLQAIVDKAVENQSRIKDSLGRLESNIERLGEVRAKLIEHLDLLRLWDEVNLKGEELLKKLDEFNKMLEDVSRRLTPNPS